MRPVGDTGKFTVATEVQEGEVMVVVTALDKDDQFVNFLNLGGIVVGPDMKPIDVAVQQTAPGRYVGFDEELTHQWDTARLQAELAEVEGRLEHITRASGAAIQVLKELLHG